MNEPLNPSESINLPELIKERQALVDQLAGTYAIPIYFETLNGVAVTENRPVGTDFLTQNRLPQNQTRLVGIAMPTGLDDQMLIIGRDSLEIALITHTPNFNLKDHTKISDLINFERLADGITLRNYRPSPLLSQGLLIELGLSWAYQITDSAQDPEIIMQKTQDALAYSRQEQARLLNARAKCAVRVHGLLNNVINFPPTEPTP